MLETGDDKQNDGKNGETSANRENLINILEIGGGLIFAMLAFACADAGFHIWGFIFGFLAVVCGLAIVAHHLQNLGLKYVKTGLVAGLILMAFLFGFLAFHKSPEELKPHPHLKLVLKNTSNWPDLNLQFTNDFLFFKEGSVMSTTDMGAQLVVPIFQAQSNSALSFVVVNDSRLISDVQEIVVSVPKDINASFETPTAKLASLSTWTFAPISIEHTKSVSVRSETDLLPGEQLEFPILKFFVPETDRLIAIPIHIQIRGNDMPTIFMGFLVKFPGFYKCHKARPSVCW